MRVVRPRGPAAGESRPDLEETTAPFEAIRPLVLDIDRPLPTDGRGSHHRQAHVLVRRGGRPVGVVDVPLDDGALSTAQVDAISRRYAARPTPDPPPPTRRSSGLPAVTVVVATHDRPLGLRRCLASVLAMDRTDLADLQVVVVDSAPSSGTTAAMLQREFPDVVYVHEDLPGLGRAHNRALPHVTSPIVAFTDDDVVVDRAWARRIAERFDADPTVGCVTGLVWPAELETPAQALIDAHGRFGKGLTLRRFDLADDRPGDPLFPYTIGQVGSGANMAFRRDALEAVGGFDPLLGAGSPGRGGDDLAAFFDVLGAGYSAVYEPAAVVHHRNRREYDDLRNQARNYGWGLTAYLTHLVVRRPAVMLDIVRLAPRGLRHLAATGLRTTTPTQVSRGELRRLQLLGMVEGPIAYVRARRRAGRETLPGAS